MPRALIKELMFKHDFQIMTLSGTFCEAKPRHRVSKDALAIGSQPGVQPMLEDAFMRGAKRRQRMRHETVQRFTATA